MNLCPLVVVGLLLQASSNGEVGVNAIVCQDASRSFLITCLTIDAVVAILCVLLKWMWDRRLVGSYATRFAIPLVIAFVVSSALIAWNPIKDEALVACIESEEFSRYITMAHVSAVPKGLALGGLITVGMYVLILLVLGLFGKMKKH